MPIGVVNTGWFTGSINGMGYAIEDLYINNKRVQRTVNGVVETTVVEGKVVASNGSNTMDANNS